VSDLLQRLREILSPNAGWLALLSALALTGMGIAAISTTEAYDLAPRLAQAQTQWLVISMIVVALCVLPHPRNIGLVAYPMLLATLVLLLVIVLPVMPRWIVPVRNGARSWIDLKVMNFQPSELAKIVFVLATAWYLRHRENYRSLLGLSVPFVIMLIPVALILKQPDMGTAMMFVPALFAMLVAAGAKLRHLGSLVGIAVLVVGVNVVMIFALPPDSSLHVLKKHQRARVVSMISLAVGEDRMLQSDAYQQYKAMTLIGAGQWLGYGENRSGTIVRFNRLPEDHNDMVFAVIVNRWGFVGGMAVLGLYLTLFTAFVIAASRSKDPFVRLSIVGFAGMIFAQAAYNIGMNMGLLPITGITLPFISYGGSSLLMTYVMVGLLLNFASRRPAIITRPSFEYDNGDAIFQ
jgi:cell division protein FtsW (lipid II flippase)